MSTKSVQQILEDPEFLKLVRQKNAVSLILTVVQLVIYFGFIGLIAYNKPYLATKIADGSAITVGIPIAVGVIIVSWLLTGVYIWWANNTYDPMVKRVKERMGR
jgi:uncharacterized membrane protein (DUF485 family)